MPRFRPILDTMPAYKPGKAVMTPDGRSYKLSSNESPLGPLPSVLAAITDAAGRVNRYPDNNAVALKQWLARRRSR